MADVGGRANQEAAPGVTLLQPLALLGLLSLPVIILLHLLRQRSRREPISSLMLWRWLEREVRGPRLRQIPITWVLLLQLLAAALLSLAIAQPQITLARPVTRGQRLILVVDTSISMGARDETPSRLGTAQARAGALLAGLGGDDSAVLIAAGTPARQLADTNQVGLAALGTELAALQPTAVGNDWAGALGLAAAAIVSEQNSRIVVFSDGAFAFPPELEALRLPARVEWQQIGAAQDNQAVVALAARPAPSGAVQVFAEVANFADTPAARTITLLADGAVADEYSAELSPSGLLGQAWTLPPGTSAVEVRLSGGGDVLPADDQAGLGVSAAGSRPVDALLVSRDPSAAETLALARALRSLPGLRLEVAGPEGYSGLARRELTVLHGWLPAAWPAGGVLVFDPPIAQALLPVRNAAPGGNASLPPAGDALLADVDLAQVTFGRAVVLEPPGWLAPVLTGGQGQGLIWRGSSGGTRVVAFSFGLGDGNLTRRPAFPVLVANAVSAVLPPALPPSIAPGQALALPAPQTIPLVRVSGPEGQFWQLGRDRPAEFAETAVPGLYSLEGDTVSGETWRAVVGVNAGAAEESELRQAARPEFEGAGPSAGADLPEAVRRLDLWPLLAMAVLAVLVVEAGLAWR